MVQGRKQKVLFSALVIVLLAAAAVPLVRSKVWTRSPVPVVAKSKPAKPRDLTQVAPPPSPQHPPSFVQPNSRTTQPSHSTTTPKPTRLTNVGPGNTLSLFVIVTIAGVTFAYAYKIRVIRLNTSI
jgi:hypothetical protein